MRTTMLPEIRPYLEHLLDEICLQAGMRVHNPQTREKLLSYLHDQLQTFAYPRLKAALPPAARHQFTFLLEQHASMGTLLIFTRRHLANLPDVVPAIFDDFRAHYLPSGVSNTVVH